MQLENLQAVRTVQSTQPLLHRFWHENPQSRGTTLHHCFLLKPMYIMKKDIVLMTKRIRKVKRRAQRPWGKAQEEHVR